MIAAKDRLGSLVPALASGALGVVLAAPILVLRYPPMGDLPFHESLVALLRHFGDPTFEPPGVYVLSLGSANQLFHFIAAALAFAMPTDVACKLVVAVSVAALPASALAVARCFGRHETCALLAAPLAMGFAFRWGLVGNVVALPLLLAALPTLDRFARAPTLRRGLAAHGLVVALYLAHESALLVAMMASALFAVRAGVAWSKRCVGLTPAATGAVLAAYYTVRSHHLKAPSILAVPDDWGPGLVARIAGAPGALFGSLDAPLLWGTFGLYGAAILAFIVSAARAREGTPERADGGAAWIAWVERNRLRLVASGCALAFLFAPSAFAGSTLLYPRFLAMALILGAVAFAPAATTPVRPIAPVLAVCATFAALFATLPAFGDADRRFRELDDLLPLIAKNSAVAQLDVTPSLGGAVAPVPGAGARALAERGGRLLFSFTDAPTSPVVVPAAHQWNEAVRRLTYDPLAFSPPRDFGRYRYALVRLAPEWRQLGPLVVKVMAPEGKLVGDSGEWILFESTIPTVPLTDPDDRLAAPPTPTLRSRLASLATH